MSIRTIGILGAGKLGVVLAQLALRSGYKVYISGAGAKEDIALTIEVLAPGAVAEVSEVVAHKADVVILALPLSKFRNIPANELKGKLVIDSMNYWWEVDGERSDILPDSMSTSEAVQEFLAESRVVKAFNHMGYHDLLDEARAKDAKGRKAIAVAGDDARDVDAVSEIVDNLGFDPLYIGSLAMGKKLEAGAKVFGADETIDKLRQLIGS